MRAKINKEAYQVLLDAVVLKMVTQGKSDAEKVRDEAKKLVDDYITRPQKRVIDFSHGRLFR